MQIHRIKWYKCEWSVLQKLFRVRFFVGRVEYAPKTGVVFFFFFFFQIFSELIPLCLWFFSWISKVDYIVEIVKGLFFLEFLEEKPWNHGDICCGQNFIRDRRQRSCLGFWFGSGKFKIFSMEIMNFFFGNGLLGIMHIFSRSESWLLKKYYSQS